MGVKLHCVQSLDSSAINIVIQGMTATTEAAMEEDMGVGMEAAELMGAEAAMEAIMTGLSLSTSNGMLRTIK